MQPYVPINTVLTYDTAWTIVAYAESLLQLIAEVSAWKVIDKFVA